MFIEELANEDVAAVINDTNRGRIRKLEARIEDLEALLAEKDETIAKKDKQINELHFFIPTLFFSLLHAGMDHAEGHFPNIRIFPQNIPDFWHDIRKYHFHPYLL